jgi:hypothetical protein
VSFLHSDDLGRACVFLIENYDDDIAINVGVGEDIPIKVRHFTLAKLFLHVGFHKTGTTSLQDALNRNRKELQSQGIVYPKTRKFRAQHEFAWSVGQRGWGWKQFGGSQAGPGPARRMFRLIRSSKQDLIISSEFLSELSPETFRS